MTDEPRTIDDVLSEAAADVATKGIGKTGRNEQQGYRFRGIDDVLNSVGPALARRGVVVTARFFDRKVERVATKNGGSMQSVTIAGEFTYWWRGNSRTTVTYGEAMDSGDKATNKAMAMATKYAHIITLSIPVVGSDDADLRSHAMGAVPGNGSRLDAIEALIESPTATGDAPAGEGAPSPKPAGARPYASYARTPEGARQFMADVQAELEAAVDKETGEVDGSVAVRVMEAHGASLLKLKQARDSVIAGNAASLIEYAGQIKNPPKDPRAAG